MEKREARRRQGMLARAPAELLADLLDEVGHLPAFLNKALRLGMHLLNAEQALVFDGNSELVFRGMESANAVAQRRQRLRPLLRRRGIVCYSLPEFAAEAEDGAPVIGMAGGVRAGGTPFVFAFERGYAPFALDEKYLLEATLGQLAHPLYATVELQRRQQQAQLLEVKLAAPGSGGLEAAQLQLRQLDPLPPLGQFEVLLVKEAMRRAENNKSIASAWLGISREGLRKKLERWGIGMGRRLHGHPSETV